MCPIAEWFGVNCGDLQWAVWLHVFAWFDWILGRLIGWR